MRLFKLSSLPKPANQSLAVVIPRNPGRSYKLENNLPNSLLPGNCRRQQTVQLTHNNMIGRSALTRGAKLALRRQDCARLAQRRAYAAAAGASTETASFESTDINGIKVASRDPRSPTARIAVVAKAGTRYQPLPGLAVGLEEFAFKASPDVLRPSQPHPPTAAETGRKGR